MNSKKARFVPLCALMALLARSATAQEFYLYPNKQRLTVVNAEGAQVLEIQPQFWGPDWKWVNTGARFEPQNGYARALIQREIAGTDVRFAFEIAVQQLDARRLRFVARVQAAETSDVTLAALAISPGPVLKGAKRATVTEGGRQRRQDLPFGKGRLAAALERLELRDGQNRAFVFAFEEPVEAAQDKDARLILAEERLPGRETRQIDFTLTLPEQTEAYLTTRDVPNPENWDAWFEWKGSGVSNEPSVIDLSDWLDAPAGRHGRVRAEGGQLIYNGEPIKFWGVNICFASTAPDRELAERRARFYARYGINAVRLHKFADGPTWNGNLTNNSSRAYEPEDLDKMDYFVHQLKEHGIYTKLSAVFGKVPLGPRERSEIPFADEFGAPKNGWVSAPQGALWFSEELQDVLIEQMINLLDHTNPHTGLRYAEDPAILAVELINENSALFYTTMTALKNSETIRREAGEAFFAWLKQRYGSEAALLDAWGDRDPYGQFRSEGFTGEGWAQGIVYPVGNPWYFDPDQLEGQMKGRRQRLLDTMVFLYEAQSAFYERFVAALRDVGYEGEVVGSNWQAGRAYSHFLNLRADARVGIIDRHNYFSGSGSMLHRPGGGTLSAGMQQVEGRPFMLSEWIHVFPNEFGVEGPAIIGAYGLGLNDWDVSFMFQNRDDGRFRDQLGEQKWDVVAPQVLGIFPAVARQVHRGDVEAAERTFARNVHIPSLKQGKLGFEDKVEQNYDVKTFGSDAVPASTLAIGRSVVRFTEQFKPTPTVDLEPFVTEDAARSATGQLRWRPGVSRRDGLMTIDTPGTQAAVGFFDGETIELSDVTLQPGPGFSAIYVTALERDETIADASRLLVTTLGRVYNTGMKYVAGRLVGKGGPPMRVEPIQAVLTLNSGRPAVVHVLNHDGVRTGETLPIDESRVTLDGVATRTVYYEIEFR